MYFKQITDNKLSQYAYLIGYQATGEAIVIDPMRDIDQYYKLAEKENLNITAAVDTHIFMLITYPACESLPNEA